MNFTIGSLFDGSGGFPLAAFMSKGTPVWASEVEPYPIAVTKTRFPYMKHLGSVTDIKGNEVEPVDVITFGSPCQDLSVAGKRAGLKHTDNGDDETTRSGLFMEAVRIIKEMREATGGKYPRFALWENVPGAFSSNKGEDFRVVCEELIKVVEPTAVMPAVPQKGWSYADYFCGDGWSLAYRVLDAQYWGVPQRRRRIYLVLDLGGERAGEVLFEREGLRGYFAEGRTPWQGTAGDAEDSTGTADLEGKRVAYGISPFHSNAMLSDNPHSGIYVADTARTLDAMNCGYPGCNQGGIAIVESLVLDDQGGQQISVRTDGKCPTLRAEMHGNIPSVMEAAGFCPEESAKTRGVGYADEQAPTLRAGTVPAVVFESHPMDSRIKELDEVAPTVSVKWHKGAADTPLVCEEKHPITYSLETFHCVSEEEKTTTLKARDYKDPVCVAYGVDCRNYTETPETYPTLQAKPNGGQSLNYSGAVRTQYIVRRLTPTECARLQGFPDKWGHPNWIDENTQGEVAEFWRLVYLTDCSIKGKKPKPRIADKQDGWEVAAIRWYNGLHTDSAEYKMWGNGIALPCALYVMQGIAEVLK